MSSRVIDQDPAHHLRRNAVEVRAILPDDALLPDQSQIRLVDECRRLKGVVRPFAAEIGSRAPPELLVDQGHQFLACLEVAFAPRPQQAADRTGPPARPAGPPEKSADGQSGVRWPA